MADDISVHLSEEEDLSEVDVYYSNLVIPASMRSFYWKFFGFPADKSNTIITRSKIICKICYSAIAYNKNTSNLKTHLTSRHPEYAKDYLKKFPREPKYIRQIENDQTDDNGAQYTIIDAKTVASANELIQILSETDTVDNIQVEMITGDNDDTVTIGNKDFENVEYLTNTHDDANPMDVQTEDENEPIISSPIPTTSSDLVEGEYVIKTSFPRSINTNIDKHLVQMIITDLLPIDLVHGKGFRHLFHDKGDIKLPSQSYIQQKLKKMYQDKKKTALKWIKTKLMKHNFSIGFDKWMNFHQTEYITVSLSYIDEESLKTYVISTVTALSHHDWDEYFNFLNMKNCSMALFNYDLNDNDNALLKYLTDNNIMHSMCLHHVVSNIGKRCFNLSSVKAILKKSMDFLNDTEQLVTCDANSPPEIHEKFWLTKFNFLEYITNVYMPSFETTDNELQQLHIDVTLVVECLKPLKVLLETLNMEQNPISSLIKPLVQQLVNSNFAITENDIAVEIEMKQISIEEFEQHIIDNRTLSLTSFIDPRLHSLTAEDDLASIQTELKEMCQHVEVIEPNLVTKLEKNIKLDTATVQNSNRKSGLEFFFSKKELKPEKRNVCTFEKEFKRFQDDVNEQFDKCPLLWWKECGHLYPYLKHVADKFNCVPAMLKPIGGIMAEDTNIHDRRAMLHGRYLDERLWLFYNILNNE